MTNKVGAICGVLFVAAIGVSACGRSGIDDTAAVKIVMTRCMKTSSRAFCDCTVKKMRSSMKPDEYAQWVRLQVAVQGAKSVDDAMKKSGLSRDEWIKLQSKFAGYGAAAGTLCAAKSSG